MEHARRNPEFSGHRGVEAPLAIVANMVGPQLLIISANSSPSLLSWRLCMNMGKRIMNAGRANAVVWLFVYVIHVSRSSYRDLKLAVARRCRHWVFLTQAEKSNDSAVGSSQPSAMDLIAIDDSNTPTHIHEVHAPTRSISCHVCCRSPAPTAAATLCQSSGMTEMSA